MPLFILICNIYEKLDIHGVETLRLYIGAYSYIDLKRRSLLSFLSIITIVGKTLTNSNKANEKCIHFSYSPFPTGDA